MCYSVLSITTIEAKSRPSVPFVLHSSELGLADLHAFCEAGIMNGTFCHFETMIVFQELVQVDGEVNHGI